MAPTQSAAKADREKKLKSVLAFASTLADSPSSLQNTALLDDLQTHIRRLPFQASSAVIAKQGELDKLGTELWNLSTRMRREERDTNKGNDKIPRNTQSVCLLRVFSFLLLDSAGGQATKSRERKTCIRLMKVALKAARVCIEGRELQGATKVLERAAEYQEALGTGVDSEKEGEEEVEVGNRLRVEYFAVRTALAWRQDRMDTAEHMFSKAKQLSCPLDPSASENLADLFYEIGKGFLGKGNYEQSIRWLERAYDALAEQELDILSQEAGELRLSIMQATVQAHMKTNDEESQQKAWHMVKLMEVDYGEKMVVSLVKLELLSLSEPIDTGQFYTELLRMIRSVVLNETNFKTIMHHIHKLKDYSNMSACKALEDLIELRLFREENQSWIEKAVITRIWVGTTNSFAENALEQLQGLFDTVLQNAKCPLSAPATHAAQTLLWKQIEAAFGQEQFGISEAWCRVCLHPLFDKAGAQNKSKVARKVILCAIARQDYAASREIYLQMSDTGKNEPVTQYLMYKVGLRSGDATLTSECLDLVCRQSTKDAALLYACVLEAQNSGDKRQAIVALEKALDKYDYTAPAGIHLPALLRCTARLLQSELVKDGALDLDILKQLCSVFEGACAQSKASRQRPRNATQQLFTIQEFEWFSKNAYNLSIKYCAEMPPGCLVRLLSACIEFIKLLEDKNEPDKIADVSLRLMFCEFLAACTFTTLARAEDNIQNCLQHYLEARNHGEEFRRCVANGIEKLSGQAHADIVLKHFQIVKLELEAVLKLEKWDELDGLFDQCWKYKSPDHYETLADLVLVIHSCVLKANLDSKYQYKVLSVLQKIINLTWRQTGNDIVKLSRWIRCLFQLALTLDESLSLKCIEQATQIAAARHQTVPPPPALYNTPPPSSCPIQPEGNSTDNDDKDKNHYPETELEWLATSAFNHAVDYYLQGDDAKCKKWAESSLVLAQWAEDNGQLRNLLLEKFSGLKWSDGGGN